MVYRHHVGMLSCGRCCGLQQPAPTSSAFGDRVLPSSNNSNIKTQYLKDTEMLRKVDFLIMKSKIFIIKIR